MAKALLTEVLSYQELTCLSEYLNYLTSVAMREKTSGCKAKSIYYHNLKKRVDSTNDSFLKKILLNFDCVNSAELSGYISRKKFSDNEKIKLIKAYSNFHNGDVGGLERRLKLLDEISHSLNKSRAQSTFYFVTYETNRKEILKSLLKEVINVKTCTILNREMFTYVRGQNTIESDMIQNVVDNAFGTGLKIDVPRKERPAKREYALNYTKYKREFPHAS